jgi:hypothetical protein
MSRAVEASMAALTSKDTPAYSPNDSCQKLPSSASPPLMRIKGVRGSDPVSVARAVSGLPQAATTPFTEDRQPAQGMDAVRVYHAT